MRWIFYSLLAINLVFFLWQSVSSDEPAPTVSAQAASHSGDIASIALLHEAQEQAEPYDLSDLAAALASSPAPSKPVSSVIEQPVPAVETWCDALGPFIDSEQGDRVADQLQALGIETSLVPEVVRLAGGYWAYIEPQASLQAAIILSSELKSQNIDAYLISEGKLSNGLSLGIFSQEADAQSLQRRLQAAEITVVIEEKAAVHQEFWVLLTAQDFAAIEPGKRLQLPEYTFQNQVIKKVCKPVASTP